MAAEKQTYQQEVLIQAEHAKAYFCQNIHYIRKQNKQSRKAMAEKLGIGVRSLSCIENGTILPRLKCSVLFAVCDIFRIRPEEMLHPMGETKSSPQGKWF